MALYKYEGGRKNGDVEDDDGLVVGQQFKDVDGPGDEVGFGIYQVTSETTSTDKGLARLIRFTPKGSSAGA